ncbi:MAG: hypothetical protein WC310_04425 [Patescibacteria group bacterium]|jgi:hypothetical protein
MILKDTILNQLHSTSNGIAKEFDAIYSQELSEFAEEMAISYQILHDIINRDDQSKISDADFQSALLFWTALNTYLSALELFRRGYSKEPQMLIRNVLEIFSAAYDIHANPEKLEVLRNNPKKFDSKKSINIVKEINPTIAQMWGNLSSWFSHVSILHTVPHRTAPLCIGGFFNSGDQDATFCGLLAPLNLTLDVLNSTLEFTFISEVSNPRFWKQLTSDTYAFSNPKTSIERGERIMEKMEKILNINKEKT